MPKTNFQTFQGNDYPINFTFKNSAGAVIVITGYTVFFTIKRNKNDADADKILTKTVTEHSDADGGVTTITLEDTDTINLLGTYYYDLKYKALDTTIHRGIDGVITFEEQITIRVV
jgi:uncharacterized lipoprotein YehR (DUF1307 family)